MSEENTDNELQKELKVYELGYLLLPTLTDEEVGKEYANLKDSVVKQGGEVISDEIPKKIPLAYSMEKIVSNSRQKLNAAYFGWIKFAMDPEKVLELKKNLSQNPQLIRFLIFRTVKENTIATKRFVRDIPYRRPPIVRKKEEATGPINKEEIDKEIEAMVATEEVTK